MHICLKVKTCLERYPLLHYHFPPISSFWLNLGERRFGEITRKRILRVVLKTVIEEFIRLNKENATLFFWTKKVEMILERVERCKATTVALF